MIQENKKSKKSMFNRIPLYKKIHFWKSSKNMEGDKGGSFDLNLYLKICEIRYKTE